jgi:prephenate dehydrogenase
MTKISILGGTGGMGSLFANFWKESGHEVATFGSDLKDVQKIADSEIVVFAVPKDKIKEITEKISDHLNQNQTVVSFSSYLGEEKEIFKNIVGEYTFIHAMFGPDILDFKGQNFIASRRSFVCNFSYKYRKHKKNIQTKSSFVEKYSI